MSGRPKRSHSGSNNRRIREACDPSELAQLVVTVDYGGNSAHKRNPGDFDLNPPAGARSHKTLCDAVAIHSKKEALHLLREGIKRGLISTQIRGGFPQNVWAVTDDGEPLQASLENQGVGTYHGYPLAQSDPFWRIVLARWNQP